VKLEHLKFAILFMIAVTCVGSNQ